MSVVEGYGGLYREMRAGIPGRPEIPPYTPKDYEDEYFDHSLRKRVYSREIYDPSRGPVGWQKMNTIYQLRYPVGYANLDKDGMVVRCFGHYPGPAVLAGLVEISESIKMIYKRVILNENRISEWYDLPHPHGDNMILRTHTIVPVTLCASQRFVILLNAIGVFFRGVITLGQIGFIFYPFESQM